MEPHLLSMCEEQQPLQEKTKNSQSAGKRVTFLTQAVTDHAFSLKVTVSNCADDTSRDQHVESTSHLSSIYAQAFCEDDCYR